MNLVERDPFYLDHADPVAKTDRRSPRASEYRDKTAELERTEAHAKFLVCLSVCAIVALAWLSASLRDELTDTRAELAVISVVLAAKNVAAREWTCRDVKAFEGNVRNCTRTVSKM
jgi:hypothetical protein